MRSADLPASAAFETRTSGTVPATGAAGTLVSDYTALLSGVTLSGLVGKSAFVSFSFTDAVPAYLAGVYTDRQLATFLPYSEAGKQAVRQAIKLFSDASGIVFFEVAVGQGDINFLSFDMAIMRPGAAGFAYYPGNGLASEVASDVFIDHRYVADTHILLHEIGHALGLKHPHEGEVRLTPEADNFVNTVMSYNFGPTPGIVLGTLDLAAMQHLYGDATRKGSHVGAWSWDAATMRLMQDGTAAADSLTGVGGANNVIQGLGGDDRLFGDEGDSLFGGAGDDEFQLLLSGALAGTRIDGGEGIDRATISFTDAVGRVAALSQIATGVEELSVTTGGGRDELTDDGAFRSVTLSTAGGNDVVRAGGSRATLYAGAGDDVLYAGSGFSFLFGGAGADRFWFESAATSTATATDQIEDYQVGVDVIDLSAFAAGRVRVEGGFGGSYVTTLDGQFRLFVRQAVARGDIDGGGGPQTGTAASDALTGDAAADSLRGQGGDDVLNGGRGADLLDGGAGDDRIDGGADVDTAVFGGAAADSRVAFGAGGVVTVAGPDGRDTLIGVEQLLFGTLTLSLAGAAPVGAIYLSWGGRDANGGELAFWSAEIAGGRTDLAGLKAAILADPLGQANTAATVGGLYRAYLGRAAGADEIGYWDAQVRAGVDFAQLRSALVNDPSAQAFTAARIAGLYLDYLGRAPAVGEVAFWAGQVRLGTDYQSIRAVLLGDAAGQANSAARIVALYDEYLGRAPAAGEIAFWSAQVTAGTEFAGVRAALLGDAAGQAHTAATVRDLYQDYLGRAPAAGEIAFWSAQVAAGTDFAGVRAALVADPGSGAAVAGAIGTVYRDYGGRAASADELAFWGGQVRAGATIDAVREAVLDDGLGRGFTTAALSGLYAELFGREAGAGEQAAWRDLFRDGFTLDAARSTLSFDPGSAGRVQRAAGTAGADVFAFGAAGRHLAITDFDPLADKLDLRGAGWGGIDPLDAAHARQITALDGRTDVLIALDATHDILLRGITLAQLGREDFLL